MDELYGDLENYQFDNIVSELRNENQELKCKLDEYATTMASLQKDFDKLSADYKKLEFNYSSLLLTARAEIERKSQMITNLNIEKDKLVIEAIQKHGRVPNRNKNVTGNKLQPGKLSKEGDAAQEKNDAPVPHANDNNFSGTFHHLKKNKQDKTTSLLNSGTINDVHIKEKEQKLNKHQLHKDKEKKKDEFKKSKESHLGVFDKGEITSNDKTTFSLGPSPKDNPDVKEDEEKSKNIAFLRDREKNRDETKNSKDNNSDGFSNSVVVNEVSKIMNRRKSMPLMNRSDFKYSSDEDQDDGPKYHRFRRKTPSRDERIYHDKYNYGRYNPERKVPDHTRVGDKHASNYDSSRNVDRKNNSRYRDNDRHKSRDNRDKYESNQRSRRHYSPDRPYNVHGDYNNKYRESNDRPHRFDNVRQRKFVSPPSEKYNHQSRRSREFDGQRFQHDALNPIKHKLHEVVEEPACKRMRRDSLNKPSDKPMFIHDRDGEGRDNSMSRQLELSYLSLQSPDHIHLENQPLIHHIKEIKATSDTKLDDPRLTSKKYIAYTHCDKVILSTVAGRDVDIKAVDTTKWNLNKDKKTCETYEMPILLKEKPPVNDDLINNIYMAIDNPLLNLSLESGQICLEDELDAVSVNKKTGNTDQDRNSKNLYNKYVQKKDQNMLSKKEPVDIIDNAQQACSTSFSKNYIIPKLKISNIPESLEEDSSNNTPNKVKSDNTKQGHKKKSNKEKRHLEKKIQPAIIDYNSSKAFSDTTDICKSKKHKSIDIKHIKQSPEKRKISTKDTVEGDLELSDETCDYVEVSEQTKFDKGNIAQTLGETNQNIIDNFNKDLNIAVPVKAERAIYKHGMKVSHDNKHVNLLNKDHEAHLKKSLSETCKEQKSKEIKSKLCDLFGDTSSLITLDDLGIVPPTTTKEHLNEYAPLFDNTQDAVDLNVEEMEKVQARSINKKSDVKEPLLIDDNKDKTPEKTKIKNKDKSFPKKHKQKVNNIENSSSIQHIFENVNTEPQDSNVVKTIIISTGVQNTCLPTDSTMRDVKHEKQPTNIQRKTNDNAISSSALLSVQALATSTPYKPQNEPALAVPENRNSNDSTAVKDDSNISSNVEKNCKVAQSNTDIPDVRIIVKRRRKAKAAPP